MIKKKKIKNFFFQAAPGESTVTVSVSVNVFEILKVDEVKENCSFQKKNFIIFWGERRYTSLNMRKNNNVNLIIVTLNYKT